MKRDTAFLKNRVKKMKLDSSEVGWETNAVQICLFIFMHVYI